ncbi:MAG: ThiF family adenylyltransferase [Candidatus Woesearchaeota archaeon]|nr:MAG: ThiF family adenylyltransferase [Candidatus Woesearchaeota archaeon]
MVELRYQRQAELIQGWDQDKLSSARIAFIGSNMHAAIGGSAVLGIGSIEVYSDASYNKNSNKFLYINSDGEANVKTLEDSLNTINPSIKVRGIYRSMEYERDAKILGKPSAIIETTNDPNSKQICFEYAKENRIPVVSASASRTQGKLMVYRGEEIKEEFLFPEYENYNSSPVPECVLSGLILRETTGLIMPRTDEENLDSIIQYNQNSPLRFLHKPVGVKDEKEIIEYNLNVANHFSDKKSDKIIDSFVIPYLSFTKPSKLEEIIYNKKVLMIGAGGLGNYCGWLTTNLAKELTIVDDDVVDETNLNRQIFFCFEDTVGQPKAQKLADVLQKLDSKTKIDYKIERVGLDFDFEEIKPDVILSCVDSFKAQSLMNYHAKKLNIPLVSGGVTSDKRGRVATYFPNINACLDCQLRIDEAAIREYQPQHCNLAPTPSVVTNNILVSGEMMGEFPSLAKANVYQKILRGALQYDSNFSSRVGLMPTTQECNCNGGEEKWLKKMEKLFKE